MLAFLACMFQVIQVLLVIEEVKSYLAIWHIDGVWELRILDTTL
jgi:hypothetical protein